MANTKLMCNTVHSPDTTQINDGKENKNMHATSLKAASISARDPSDLAS